MMTLEQLLDGLDVDVEPFVVHEARRRCPLDLPRIGGATVPCTRGAAGVLELADGASMSVSNASVVVRPPRPHAPAAAAPSPESAVLVACSRMRATYRGSVDLFSSWREPVVEPFAEEGAIAHAVQF